MTLVNSDSRFWEREDGTPFNFWAILSVGWVGFFVSIILNVLLYKVHPSGVPFSLSHPKKMRVHVCGREYNLRKTSEGNARMCFLTLINFPDSDARANGFSEQDNSKGGTKTTLEEGGLFQSCSLPSVFYDKFYSI